MSEEMNYNNEEVKSTIIENVNEIEVAEGEVEGVKIADEVVAIIAGIAASDVPGVAGMSGGFVGGIAEILGKRNLSKGVKVEVGEKETSIDVNIIVEYGVRIPDVAWEIQNRVKKSVETMTGLKVLEVNIHVQGVNIDKNFGKKEEVVSAEETQI